MGDKISLRAMLLSLGGVSVLFMLIRATMVSGNYRTMIAWMCTLGVLLAIFLLYAIAYLVLLPFGVMARVYEESAKPAISPFANDRLPETLLPIENPLLDTKAH